MKEGQFILISQGERFDYKVVGFYKVIKDFNEDLFKTDTMRTYDGIKRTVIPWYPRDASELIEQLTEKKLVKNVPFEEIRCFE